jgi:hypothetical protein
MFRSRIVLRVERRQGDEENGRQGERLGGFASNVKKRLSHGWTRMNTDALPDRLLSVFIRVHLWLKFFFWFGGAVFNECNKSP